MKTTIILILVTVLLFASACGATNNAPDQQNREAADTANAADTQNSPQNIGEGQVVFLFEVTDGEGKITSWNVHTNETTVGAALVELGMIEGAVSDFGMMVSYVNGIRADFVEDGAWWAFYIDGEMAMVGVDSTDIETGVTYAFIYTDA